MTAASFHVSARAEGGAADDGAVLHRSSISSASGHTAPAIAILLAGADHGVANYCAPLYVLSGVLANMINASCHVSRHPQSPNAALQVAALCCVAISSISAIGTMPAAIAIFAAEAAHGVASDSALTRGAVAHHVGVMPRRCIVASMDLNRGDRRGWKRLCLAAIPENATAQSESRWR